MGDVDPEMLLEWLEMGNGEVRDMQLVALEQLCMLLLMSDNIDHCFESCPPRTFLPALCHIFMDETAPENVLEVTARAMTYYLDVSAECTRRIVTVDGAVKALCDRLTVNVESRTSKDLAEQCIKVLEFMVTREAGLVFEAGGLPAVLCFISSQQRNIHKDTLHSAMSVVSKLCTKCEPTDPTLPQCVSTLSTLLQHEDTQVSDGTLRCFASLSDRFTRKNIDPAPLGEHGLVEELLKRLTATAPTNNSFNGTTVRTGGSRQSAGPAGSQIPSEGTVSTVISLLSTLCRGSDSITETLLKSNLADAINAALQANERCVLDTMRLIDLLLLLMFEGRRALPRSTQPSTNRISRTGDSANHKQLIDCIRSKDSNALMQLIENGNFSSDYDVNFMDDVGQTLLNWASAFGTLPMVYYLASKGADVNRGQRSSSLHYAACFGRPAITKALLKNGANPDLRDEDGKTPMDKAREKNDEGHREVVHILQNPGEWMSEQAPPNTESSEVEVAWVRDNQMIIKYLQHWIPQFTNTFHTTLYHSVRKSSLTLLRKLVRYITPELLEDLNTPDAPYSACIVETIAAVLDTEEYDEGTVPALMMVRDLADKGSAVFIEHFCRLGVISQISKRAKLYTDEKQKIDKEDLYMEDATEILPHRPYHWCQWSIIHARDCVYLWCDYAAIALSSGSNGWFSFILDNRLATIYSAGSLDSNASDSSESRCEFLEKLQRAKSQVYVDMPSQPVLSVPGVRITVDNWSFQCRREGEIAIDNAEGHQSTILREDLPGFIFESNKGTTHSFNAETTLGPEFAAGWGKKSRKVKTKSEQQKQQISVLSEEIYEKFFKDKIDLTRPVVTKIKEILVRIDKAVTIHNENKSGGTGEWKEMLKAAFTELAHLLQADSSLSTFELNACRLVPCLLSALGNEPKHSNCSVKQQNAINLSLFKSQERMEVFKESFLATYINENGDMTPFGTTLVKKLVNVMERVEKLPLYLYESPGAMYGLQVLTRRLRFRLERFAGEHTLLDRSGRTLKIEPLTAVKTLEDHLRKSVAKQWYDYDRSTFGFIRELRDVCPINFTYTSDFDEGGILYWIGTNGKTNTEWKNPSTYRVVVVSSSDGRSLPYGSLDDTIAHTQPDNHITLSLINDTICRDTVAKNVHTNDDKNGWISIDLALWVIPNKYTVRHARGYGRSALRNWLFQGSKDSKAWVTLRSHVEDTALSEPGSTASWTVVCPVEEKQGWRHFRIHLNGKNSSGQTHYLSLSGMEIYGTVTGVCDDPPTEIQPTKPPPERTDKALKRLNREADSLLYRQRLRFYRRQVLKNISRASRSDWKQSDTESVKSSSSTGGEPIPGTPDSTEAMAGGSETHSVGTISSTPDVTTVDEIDQDAVSKPDSLTASFNQRNLRTDLESFVMELAQAVMDNDSDRTTVCTINELLGALPTTRVNSEPIFDLEHLTTPRSATTNSVEQNNANNTLTGTSTQIYHFEDEDQMSDLPDVTGDTPTEDNFEREFSISEIEILPSLADDPSESITTGEAHILQPQISETLEILSSDLPENSEETQSEPQITEAEGYTSALEILTSDNSEPTSESQSSENSEQNPEPHLSTSEIHVEIIPGMAEETSHGSEETSLKQLMETMNTLDMRGAASPVPGSDISESTFDSQESDIPSSIEPFIDLSTFDILTPSFSSVRSEDSPSTPTNDLSIQPGSSNEHNVTPHTAKSEPASRSNYFNRFHPWPKGPPVSRRTANEGTPVELLSLFPTSPLAADDTAQQDMEIEDDDDEDDDEDDEDMRFDLDMESEDEAEVEQKGPLRKRVWDDDFVLKRQFSALIAAFDPRPGRTNVAQTTDVEVPVPGPVPNHGIDKKSTDKKKPRLALFIRAPTLPGTKPEEYLCPPSKTIFSCIISLHTRSRGGYLPTETLRRLWEPTYTLVYREMRASDYAKLNSQDVNPFQQTPFKPRWELDYVRKYLGTERLPKMDLVGYLQSKADTLWLKKWRLTGSPRSIRKAKNCSNLVNAYKDFLQYNTSEVNTESESWYGEFTQCLNLLGIIYNTLVRDNKEDPMSDNALLAPENFHSTKLTNRLMQQVQEPLILATSSLPDWCNNVVQQFPMLIPFDTRSTYFSSTAFGISRSIHWLQTMRDSAESRPRTVVVRRQDEMGEFRIGRLKHERSTIPRGEDFLDWAFSVLRTHGPNKSVLEIEFQGEEGTGIGPTLEFYALVSAELQRKDIALWLSDDEVYPDDDYPADLGQGPKPPGYYVRSGENGLFPAPYPQDSPELERICSLFHMMGSFVAKSLQDSRLVDLPLALPFFKMMCQGDVSCSNDESEEEEQMFKSASLSSLTESECRYRGEETESRYRGDSDAASDISSAHGSSMGLDNDESSDGCSKGKYSEVKRTLTIEDAAASTAEPLFDTTSDCSLVTQNSWFAGLLNNADFTATNPYRASFISSLEALVEKKKNILSDISLSEKEKSQRLEELTLPSNVKLEDLCLDFTYAPPSTVYGYSTYELKSGGERIPLNIKNIEEYIDLIRSFCLDIGIRRQMEAFSAGFNQVFNLSHLRMFSPSELMLLLCGEMKPDWTREDLINYTDPKFGYTKDSRGFLDLVEILVDMKGYERKSFLQFATGCSSLPPGGLANLHPRLTVVKKEGEQTLPSVNTCVHYLKLPEYESKEVMKSKLLQAIEEKGFHLN